MLFYKLCSSFKIDRAINFLSRLVAREGLVFFLAQKIPVNLIFSPIKRTNGEWWHSSFTLTLWSYGLIFLCHNILSKILHTCLFFVLTINSKCSSYFSPSQLSFNVWEDEEGFKDQESVFKSQALAFELTSITKNVKELVFIEKLFL